MGLCGIRLQRVYQVPKVTITSESSRGQLVNIRTYYRNFTLHVLNPTRHDKQLSMNISKMLSASLPEQLYH